MLINIFHWFENVVIIMYNLLVEVIITTVYVMSSSSVPVSAVQDLRVAVRTD